MMASAIPVFLSVSGRAEEERSPHRKPIPHACWTWMELMPPRRIVGARMSSLRTRAPQMTRAQEPPYVKTLSARPSTHAGASARSHNTTCNLTCNGRAVKQDASASPSATPGPCRPSDVISTVWPAARHPPCDDVEHPAALRAACQLPRLVKFGEGGGRVAESLHRAEPSGIP